MTTPTAALFEAAMALDKAAGDILTATPWNMTERAEALTRARAEWAEAVAAHAPAALAAASVR